MTLTRALRMREQMSLSGLDAADMDKPDGWDPLDDVDDGTDPDELDYLRRHVHRWNADSYCDDCSADGLA